MNSREREMNLRIGGFWNFGFGFCFFLFLFVFVGFGFVEEGIERGRWIWRRGVLDGRKMTTESVFLGATRC